MIPKYNFSIFSSYEKFRAVKEVRNSIKKIVGSTIYSISSDTESIANMEDSTYEELYLIACDFDTYIYEQLFDPVDKLIKMDDSNELALSQLGADILQCIYTAINDV